jgi:hypothetical protein
MIKSPAPPAAQPLRKRDGSGGDTHLHSITSWLDLLTSLLDVPDAERRAVRDELESHLRDRVRDLIVGGCTEAEASARAISELGDAAALARRFKDAIEPSKRRLIMNVAAISIAGAAILFSGIAVFSTRATAPCPPGETQPEAARQEVLLQAIRARAMQADPFPSVQLAGEFIAPRMIDWSAHPGEHPAIRFERPLLAAAGIATAPASIQSNSYEPPADESLERLREVRVTLTGQPPWQMFFDAVGQAAKLRPVPQWDRLEQRGVKRDGAIRVGADISAAAVLAEENMDLPDGVAAHIEDDRIIFAPQSVFDRQDQQLVVYDLAALIERQQMVISKEAAQIIDEISDLITHLVEPEQWRSSGGDRASMHRFDAKLFVQAPRRFHNKIQWIIQQLSEGKPIGMNHSGTDPAPLARPAERVPAPASDPAAAAAPALNEAPQVYVDGAVPRPGVYALPTAGQLSVARAIVAAGGADQDATDVVVMRHHGSKQAVVHRLSAADVRAGVGPDPFLLAGDRLVVHTADAK